jgi:hypothetical protein
MPTPIKTEKANPKSKSQQGSQALQPPIQPTSTIIGGKEQILPSKQNESKYSKIGILSAAHAAEEKTRGFRQTLIGGLNTLTGVSAELTAIASDPVSRERAINTSPEEFKEIFPSLGELVDKKWSKVVKSMTGSTARAGAEAYTAVVGPAASATGRLLTGGVTSGAQSFGRAMEKDKTGGEIAAETGLGVGLGVLISGAFEAGKSFTNVLKEKSLAHVFKHTSDFEKVGRTSTQDVDEFGKVLAEMNPRVASEKGLKNWIKKQSSTLGAKLGGMFDDNLDNAIEMRTLTPTIDDLTGVGGLKLDQKGKETAEELLNEYAMRYGGKTVTTAEAFAEKQGLGAAIGQKVWNSGIDPNEYTKRVIENKIRQHYYFKLKDQLVEKAKDPETASRLFDQLSVLYDAKALIENGGKHGAHWIQSTLGALGGALAGPGVAGATGMPGVAGVAVGAAAVGLGVQALQSTPARLMYFTMQDILGDTLASKAGLQMQEYITQNSGAVTAGKLRQWFKDSVIKAMSENYAGGTQE